MQLASFQVDTLELARRQRRCRPLLEGLGDLPTETVSECPACASPEFFVLTCEDRYGLPLRSAMCRVCGLVFQVDRFTAEGFQSFYGGAYRDLVSQFKGRADNDLDRLKGKQVVYGRSLLEMIRGRVDPSRINRILDIGGSTGVVSGLFCDTLDAKATVVDPAAKELALARGKFHAVEATLEDWRPDGPYDLVLLCNTIEHLRDLGAGFAKLRHALGDGGLLLCDIADFMASCRLEGPPEVVAKVDHCHWVSLETAREVFALLGFEVTWAACGRLPQQVTFLLRPMTLSQPTTSEDLACRGVVNGMLTELQTLRGQWLEVGRRPAGIVKRSRSRLSALARRFRSRQ